MNLNTQSNLGKISITTDAIASLTGAAISQCYGVVGMASKQFIRDSIAMILNTANYSKGVVVRNGSNGLELDVYIILCYGVNVFEVTSDCQRKIKFELENTLDIKFAAINIFVQGVKIID